MRFLKPDLTVQEIAKAVVAELERSAVLRQAAALATFGQAAVLRDLPAVKSEPAPPETLLQRVATGKPLQTAMSIEEYDARGQRIKEQAGVDNTVSAMGQFSECCGVNVAEMGRVQAARIALARRLLHSGVEISQVAAASSLPVSEVQALAGRQ